jgi:hypothetical protein
MPRQNRLIMGAAIAPYERVAPGGMVRAIS